jgi:hypothetical protein
MSRSLPGPGILETPRDPDKAASISTSRRNPAREPAFFLEPEFPTTGIDRTIEITCSVIW